MSGLTRYRGPWILGLAVWILTAAAFLGPEVCWGTSTAPGVAVDEDQITASLAAVEAEPVSLATALRVADIHAKRVFEHGYSRGLPILLHDQDGLPYSYVVPYSLNGQECPSHDQILQAVKKAKGIRPRTGGKVEKALLDTLGPMGCIEIAARRTNYPILVVRRTLHPYFLNYEEALAEARKRLDSPGASLVNMEFNGPHELYFNFTSEAGNLKLHAYSLRPPEEMRPCGPGPEAVQGSEPQSDPNREQKEAAWREADSPAYAGMANTYEWIPYYALIPVVDWTHWCVPTAWTMTAGFWDFYDTNQGTWTGFGRVIDYWFDHPAICQNNNITNVPNLIDEMITHTGNCSWAPGGLPGALNDINGYNFTITDIAGTKGNDWCWQHIVDEVRRGRPFVWGVGPANGHAMTAWGFRTVGTQKFVLVYNTWGSTAEAQMAEYSYDEWSGAPNTKTGVGLLEPAGGTGAEHAVLISPRGGETVFGSTQISWFVWGNSIAWTIIYYSPDGGTTWSLVSPGWFLATTAGWNTYNATLNSATTKGRIKIECFSSELDYIAGDGSPNHFIVAGKPDLVPVATCKTDSQGNLLIRVKNQGTVEAEASITRVTFYPGGQSDLLFPPIGPGDTAEVPLNMPGACWNPDCDYQIQVDVNNGVNESDETNNTAPGSCFG